MIPSRHTFRENKTQITGSSCESRSYHTFFDTCNRTPSSAHQIAETLYDHSAAQHIGKTGNAFAISITVFKWLGEMFGNKKCEVGVIGLFLITLIAMSVYSDDAVGIFRLLRFRSGSCRKYGRYLRISLYGRRSLLSYSSSVRCEKITAGSSTRTPISTRLDLVGMFRSLQTVSIHLLPLRPTETIHFLTVVSSFFADHTG